MPAGPAPITATRSGLPAGGSPTTPSSDTVTRGILTRAGCPAPARRCSSTESDAAEVVVQRVRRVLGEGHPAAQDQRRPGAVGLRLGQRRGPGEPAVATDEGAGRWHAADDGAPLVARRVEAHPAPAREQVVGHAL